MLPVYIIPLCIVYPSLCVSSCFVPKATAKMSFKIIFQFYFSFRDIVLQSIPMQGFNGLWRSLTRNCLHIFVFIRIFQGSSHEMLKNFITLLRSKPLYFSWNCLFFPPSLHSFLPFFTIPFLLFLQLVNQLTNYFLANLSIFFLFLLNFAIFLFLHIV